MAEASDKPKHVVAKPVREIKNREVSKRQTWASICYYYPQYTLKEASLLSSRDIRLLLTTARRLEASRMKNLVQIAAAPHTKKGSGVKKLLDFFQKEIDS